VIGMGNNPMADASVAVAVAIEQALSRHCFKHKRTAVVSKRGGFVISIAFFHACTAPVRRRQTITMVRAVLDQTSCPSRLSTFFLFVFSCACNLCSIVSRRLVNCRCYSAVCFYKLCVF
jgi:hypothetical protein